MIYVYGITRVGTAVPALSGIGGAGVEGLDAGGLRAVCSAVAAAPGIERAALLAHQRVLEGVMAHGCVLPARFGTCVAEPAALAARLRRHHMRLRASLAEVHGHAELGVRARWDRTPGPRAPGSPERQAGSGREYLLGMAARQQAADRARGRAWAASQQVHPTLAAAAAAARLQVMPDERTPFAGAYLVPSGRVERFQRLVDRLAAGRQGLLLGQSGPWPPYSFAPRLDDEEAGDA